MTLPAHAEDRLARSVLGPSLGVQPNEVVTIESWSHALPWALALVREVRRRRAKPILVVEDEETFFESLRVVRPNSVPQIPLSLVEASDVYVYLPGPESFPRLFGLNDRELHRVVSRFDAQWWRAARQRRVRFARLAIASATSTAADHFGIDVEGWSREVWRASLFPPGQLRRKGRHLLRRLARARRVRVRHPNGTDWAVELRKGRGFVEDGRVDTEDYRSGHLATQVPSGLVAVSLRSSTAEGVWESNRQTYHRFQDPPTAVGARFVFRDGRLKEYSFDRGGEAFAATYARGGRGRDRATRLTFGLNPAIVRAPEFEEIADGMVTLWLGSDRPPPERGPVPFSFLSPLAGADVEVDGEQWWVGGRPVRVARRAGPS